MDTPTIIKGRYQINEILGKGGMGVVYKAFDSVLRRDVAIKTLLDVSDPEALQLFHREYEVLAHINHPNIVEIIDIGEFDSRRGREALLHHAAAAGIFVGPVDQDGQPSLDRGTCGRHHFSNLPGTARRT